MGGTCQIVSIQSARNSDDVRSGILTEMCPERIKIHFNLTRLQDHAAVFF